MSEPTAEHLKAAQLDLNRANLFLNHSRAKHSDYCWQCDQPWPCDSMAAIIDADHEWAQWFEKWKAALDLVASFASREQAVREANDRLRCELRGADDEIRYQAKRAEAAEARLKRVENALRELVWIIDKAGLLNLSNGVQLGQTSWYVKANDRLEGARAALAAAQSSGEKPSA